MKISKDLKLLTTTQTELARTMGVSQPYISQLVKTGIVVCDKNDKPEVFKKQEIDAVGPLP